MNYWTTIAAALAGAFIGFAYYAFVGCSGGSCLISSNPYLSSIYGSLMGVTAIGWPGTKKIKTTTNNE